MKPYQPKLNLSDWHKTDPRELDLVLTIVAPELHAFIRDHHDLSKMMDKVREGYSETVYQEALKTIYGELHRHFYYEEQFILPKLAWHVGTEAVGPCAKIRQEHATIWRNYEEARARFEADRLDRPEQETIHKMNLLAYLLKKHIEKEDHYFFPMVSRILTDEEKKEIAAEVAKAERGV